MTIDQFTIQMDGWSRGRKRGDRNQNPDKGDIIQLLNDNGHKCCLGFACYAVGLKHIDLLRAVSPIDITQKLEALPASPLRDALLDPHVVDAAMLANGYTNAANEGVAKNRRSEIRKAFAPYGVSVRFV